MFDCFILLLRYQKHFSSYSCHSQCDARHVHSATMRTDVRSEYCMSVFSRLDLCFSIMKLLWMSLLLFVLLLLVLLMSNLFFQDKLMDVPLYFNFMCYSMCKDIYFCINVLRCVNPNAAPSTANRENRVNQYSKIKYKTITLNLKHH